jgi:hypothetical protein
MLSLSKHVEGSKNNFYLASFSISWHRLLCHSLVRSVFMASVVERSETPMKIGALFYVLHSIQLIFQLNQQYLIRQFF